MLDVIEQSLILLRFEQMPEPPLSLQVIFHRQPLTWDFGVLNRASYAFLEGPDTSSDRKFANGNTFFGIKIPAGRAGSKSDNETGAAYILCFLNLLGKIERFRAGDCGNIGRAVGGKNREKVFFIAVMPVSTFAGGGPCRMRGSR